MKPIPLSLALALAMSPALAEDIDRQIDDAVKAPGGVLSLTMDGELEPRDLGNVRSALERVERAGRHADLAQLNLTGGDEAVAEALAQELNAHGVEALVPPARLCVNACVVLLLETKRHSIGPGAAIGLSSGNRLLVESLVREHHLPRETADAVEQTPPGTIYFLDQSDVHAMGVSIRSQKTPWRASAEETR